MSYELVPQRTPVSLGVSATPYGPTPGPSPGLLRRVLRRHPLLIAGCTAALVGATGYFTWRAAPQYEATASIRIADQADDPRLAQLGGARSPTPGELPTEIEVLQSRALAEAVADSLALQVELEAPIDVPRQTVFPLIQVGRGAARARYRLELRPDGSFDLRDRASGGTLGVLVPGARTQVAGLTVELAPAATRHRVIDFQVYDFDDAVAALQGALDIRRRNRDANIMDVTYKAPDPQLARDVPNALAARFITGLQKEHHAKDRSTGEFLRAQIAKLSTNLIGAEDSLRTFRERNDVVSLADEASSGVSRMAELQAKRDAVEAERVALARLVQAIQASSRSNPAGAAPAYQNLLAFPTLLHDQAIDGLLISIGGIEDRRSDLLTRRSPQDRDVQMLTARANQLRDQIRMMALTYLDGLANQVAALDAVLARSRWQLSRIPEKELRFARLQREARGYEEIVTQLQSQLKETEIAEAVEDPSVQLVDAAAVPRVPVSPKPLLNLTLALFVGLMLGTSGGVVLEHLDKSVHSRHDILFATGVPVLGLVPRARGPRWWSTAIGRGNGGRQGGGTRAIGQNGGGRRPRGRPVAPTDLIHGTAPLMLVEAYNRLDTNLGFAWSDAATRALAITSPLPAEGKTTVAVNLAVTLARRGARVLLVDADLRCGVVANLFGITPTPGLSDLLLETVQFADAACSIAVSETRWLDVVCRGRPFDNPLQLLGAAPIRTLLASLRAQYDSVIIDTPPANLVADAAVIGTLCDGVIVVARAGVTDVPALEFAMEQLALVRAPVLGTVLNDIDMRRDAAYDEGYRYYVRSNASALRSS